MRQDIFDFIVERQNSNRVTTIGTIMKTFKMKIDEVAEELSENPAGFELELSDDEVVKTTSILIYAEDSGEEQGEESEEGAEQEEQEQEPATEYEPVVADAPRSGKRGAFEAGVYPNFETAEQADAAYPGGYLTMADLAKQARAANIKIGRIVKAFGGDKLKHQPLSQDWTPFTIQGKSKRYLPNLVVDQAMRFNDDAYWDLLWGKPEPVAQEDKPKKSKKSKTKPQEIAETTEA